MEQERIVIQQGDPSKKIESKNEDRTCRVIIKNRGIFEGIIDSISSSGKYIVLLTKKIQDG